MPGHMAVCPYHEEKSFTAKTIACELLIAPSCAGLCWLCDNSHMSFPALLLNSCCSSGSNGGTCSGHTLQMGWWIGNSQTFFAGENVELVLYKLLRSLTEGLKTSNKVKGADIGLVIFSDKSNTFP